MDKATLFDLLVEVEEVARAAGALLMKYYGTISPSEIETKAQHDFVSVADKECEALCLELLSKKYPNFDFLGEEGTSTNTNAMYRWIIDPLDGTTNFLRGIPIFAVSIGLESRETLLPGSPFGKRILGVVYNPASNDLYCAAENCSAFRNGKPISVNHNREFSDAIFATGFPFRAKQFTEDYLSAFRKMFRAGSSMRRCGAASIDLCWVASGTLDGYWELNLAPWDIAGGEVIVREAGGIVGSIAQCDDPLVNGCIWAAPPQLYDEGFALLRSIFPETFAPKASRDAT
ncbi:MAG: inositol monophosphatase [bacterium]|nr:inositol monophosphatase [bacterium]